MTWSAQQEGALDAVGRWLADPDRAPVFRLFGFAGTGKTTLAVHLGQTVKGRVCYGAFTGKAALVMASKGCVGARTIHSLIYTAKTSKRTGKTRFVLNLDSEIASASLVIIDECSMVGEEIAKDLLHFGVPILVLGDPAQLPPVGNGAGFFTNAEPDVMLSEIHRQAIDNPIIGLSMRVRQGGELKYGDFGAAKIIHKADIQPDMVTGADQVLVGRNKTRLAYNRRMRQIKGYVGDFPAKGERLICLKNDYAVGIFNGSMWTADRAAGIVDDAVALGIRSEDDNSPRDVLVRKEFFTGGEEALEYHERRGFQEFTYGYAVTVHKAQGSQWNDVFLFDESGAFRQDARRWLYTGITRAAERITIVR